MQEKYKLLNVEQTQVTLSEQNFVLQAFSMLSQRSATS